DRSARRRSTIRRQAYRACDGRCRAPRPAAFRSRRAGRRSRAQAGSFFFPLDLLPQRFQRAEVTADAAFGRELLDPAKAALELRGGAAQRGFRLDVELAREIGRREQQVADLLFKTL